MFIKKICIINFRSIKLLRTELAAGISVDELSEVNPHDFTDAIRFILDPSWAEPIRNTLPANTTGYVCLWLELHEHDLRPVLFINKDDDVRSINVTRFINKSHCPPDGDISLKGHHNTDRNISIETFHMLLYGDGPVMSSKLNLLRLGQDMRDQIFRPTNRSYLQVHRERFNKINSWLDLLARNKPTLKKSLEKALFAKALGVELASRREHELQDALQQHQQELVSLPESMDDSPEVASRFYDLKFNTCRLEFQIQQQTAFAGVLFQSEAARFESFKINIEAAQRAMANNAKLQPVANFAAKLTAIADTLDERNKTYLHDLSKQLQVERDLNRFGLVSLSMKCADMDTVRSETLYRCIEELRSKVDGYVQNIDKEERALERYMQFVGECKAKLASGWTADGDLTKRLAVQCRALNELDKKRLLSQVENSNNRIHYLGRLPIDLFGEEFLKVFSIPTLSAAHTIHLIVSDIRTEPDILNGFVGFVMDFVTFKREHRDLALKAQHALSHLLLNAIFKTEPCVDRVRTLMLDGLAAFRGCPTIWALDRYRPHEHSLGLTPENGFKALVSFLNPINCSLVFELMSDFIVMDTDQYTIDEAVCMFKRNVICARSGCWQMMSSPECKVVHWPGVVASDFVIFDFWRTNEVERNGMIRAAQRVSKEWMAMDDQRRAINEQIMKIQQDIRTNSTSLIMQQYDLQTNQHKIFITNQILLKYNFNLMICRDTISVYQDIVDGNLDTVSLAEDFRRLGPQSANGALSLHDYDLRSSNEADVTFGSFEEFHRLVRETQMAQPSGENAEWLNEMHALVLEVKEAFTDKWNAWAAPVDGSNLLESRITALTQMRENFKRRNRLQVEVLQTRDCLKKISQERKALDGVFDLDVFSEDTTDEELNNLLEECYKENYLSYKQLLDKQKRFDELERKLRRQHKVIGAILDMMHTSMRMQTMKYRKVLQHSVNAMNELLPMVYHVEPNMLKSPSIELFLIYEDTRRNAVATTINLEPNRIKSFEIVLRTGDAPQDVGQYEKQCVALLWHLAGATVSCNPCHIVLLNELIQMFPRAQREHIVSVLAHFSRVNQRQVIVVAPI